MGPQNMLVVNCSAKMSRKFGQCGTWQTYTPTCKMPTKQSKTP